MNKVFSTPDEALFDISEGATIMFGGFAEVGLPRALIEALARRGTRNITTIANECGVGFQKGTNLSLLVERGQVRRMIASYPVAASAQTMSPFERLYREGKIELELVPQGTLAERIRCGGAGIAAFYTPTGMGTFVAQGKEVREFSGRSYLLERALKADFSFVHAYKGDTLGNLVYRRTARNFSPIMAMAARVTIAEVEEIVPAGALDPEAVVTPGIFVHRLVQVGGPGR
ncbi:MAG: 3-oxoacid CoA-transferase subunit A [Chloroflexi bacterium]|nr:3-oxoacid CoA-transferase subunit A [Chloroflexota bacterium]